MDVLISLLSDIKQLLILSGGYYKDGINEYAESCIICTLVTGQFLYKKDAYFLNWYFLDDITLQKYENGDSSVFEHVPSYDITSGQHMRVQECGIIDHRSMLEIRRKLRKRGKHGVSWFREKTKRQVKYDHQKGQCRDDIGRVSWDHPANNLQADH